MQAFISGLWSRLRAGLPSFPGVDELPKEPVLFRLAGMKTWISILAAAAALTSARAEIKTETVEYQQGGVTLEGKLTYDTAISGKRPAVLVFHQWKGSGDYEKRRSEMLARLGYAAFAADVYGKGVRPKETSEASATAAKYKNDRKLMRERVNAALAAAGQQSVVDPGRIAAIGYCFGGTCALELARSGAEVGGVVSFHGGLGSPAPEDARQIKAKVLALHGADDPFVPPKEVEDFSAEMRNAKVDWQLVAYGGAVHSFTDSNAGNDNSRGSAYNEKADKRSWDAMKSFLAETFPPKQ